MTLVWLLLPGETTDLLCTCFKRILGYINSGKSDGATIATGGSQRGDEGFFIEPTIFTDVSPSMKISQEEIFGPVAAVIKFKTDEGVYEELEIREIEC